MNIDTVVGIEKFCNRQEPSAIECDHCGERLHTGRGPGEFVRAQANMRGWSWDGYRDLCPKCNGFA